MNHTKNFDYAKCKNLQNLKQIKFLDFEKVGKLAFGKVMYNNEKKGAVITFNGDNVQNCDIVNIQNDVFVPFFINAVPHILIDIYNSFRIVKLDSNTGKIKEELSYPVGFNAGELEITSGIVEYNGRLFLATRSLNIDSYLYRFVSFDKNFKNIKISLPITLNIDVKSKITSFFFSPDPDGDIHIFFDVDDTESMVITTSIDLLTKIYKNLWNN